MFDANLRYLPKGYKFFADVYTCEQGTPLYEAGVRVGHVLYGEMLDESEKNPTVSLRVGDSSILVSDDEEFYEYWLVYAGNIKDGELHDFISDESKIKAIKILKEYNYEQ